jgi:sarcosine oxidase
MDDVIVIGLGGMGSAVAAHAARRGLRVVGLEQFDPVHDRGASTGKSRIIRKAYFEDPAYVPLLLRAYELWRELEGLAASDILTITGMLMLGGNESPILAGARLSAQRHGLRIEELGARDVEERYPMMRTRRGEVAVVEPDAGFVRPEAAIAAQLDVARVHGAQLHFGAAVRAWDVVGDERVEVTLTSGEHFAARRLVLCLGPWFVEHAAALGVPLRIQRNVQAWFGPADPRFAVGTLPVFFVDRPDYPMHLYGFPDIGDGLKAAFHGYGETTRPGDLRRDVDAVEIEAIRSALDDFMPGAGGSLCASKVCMYRLTPDEHFVVAPHPDAANVIVAGGFSGHGFKFCSVMGEIITDLVERGESRHDIAFLSPTRFANVLR